MINDFKIIDERYEAGNRAMRSYVTGFALSILFTLLPYMAAVTKMFGNKSTVIAIIGFGVLQLFVQVVFFLHLHKRSKPHWNIIVFIFAILIVAILVVGSLWVMYNLNYNMIDATPSTSNEGYIPQ